MKTRKNFKRRALLVSIAMLMVAAIALGTATFAWFTQNPTANATGLVMKTSTSAGLVMRTATHVAVDANAPWVHTDYLNYAADADGDGAGTAAGASTLPVDLQPVSFGPDASAMTVTAADSTNYAAEVGAIVAGADASAYYSENIYLKVTGGNAAEAQITNVKMAKVNNSMSISDSVRLLIVNDNGDYLGTYGLDTAGNLYLISNGAFAAATSLSPAVYDYTQTSAAGVTVNKSVGEVKTDGTDYVTVYVYLDGEDSACYAENVDLTSLVQNIDITFELVANP